jgi:uncharacterized membrane protein
VAVCDFNITAETTALIVAPGTPGTSPIKVTNLAGSACTVNLATTVSPTGPTASVNPASLTLTANGTAFSTLTVSATSTTPSGTYLVTVNGSSGIFSHSTTVKVTVNNPAIPAPPRFVEFEWDDRLELSAGSATQSYVMLVLNPNINTTLFVNVQITVTTDSGLRSFTVNSGVLQAGPGQQLDIRISQVFTGVSAGQAFTFSAQILWGTSPTALTNISTQHDPRAPIAGTFSIEIPGL